MITIFYCTFLLYNTSIIHFHIIFSYDGLKIFNVLSILSYVLLRFHVTLLPFDIFDSLLLHSHARRVLPLKLSNRSRENSS